MLEMTVLISEVDYSTISERVIPMLLEKTRDGDENNRIGALLARFAKLPEKAAAAALSVLPQSAKDDIAMYLIRTYDQKVLCAIENFFRSNRIPLCINSIAVERTEDIEMCIRFADIDYGGLIGAAYPILVRKTSENDTYGKLIGLLDKIGDTSDKVIQAIVDALSQEEKDELTVYVINAYEPEILSLINALAAENEIKLSFAGVKIRNA